MNAATLPTGSTTGRVALALALVGAAALLHAPNAAAGRWIVPDNYPTVQAGLDALAASFVPETLLVRTGIVSERVQISSGIVLQAMSAEDGPQAMPRIGELVITPVKQYYALRFGIACIGLQVTGRATTFSGNGPVDIRFEACQLDSGLADGSESTETSNIDLLRCVLRGPTTVHSFYGKVDSCVIEAPLTLRTDEGEARVRDNRFEPMPGVAATVFARSAEISRNVVGGAAQGFAVRTNDDQALFEDNVIEDCVGVGIHADAGSERAIFRRNHVSGCGGDGIVARGAIEARDNVVLACGGSGIVLENDRRDGVIEDNVVGRCGGDGVRASLAIDDEIDVVVRRNTVHACDGSGFVIAGVPATVANNIGHGNGGFGLHWTGASAPALACNDWFGNQAGAVNGGAGPTDLAVDPQFCDLDADDVQLFDESPLVDAPGCGRVGARGVGCDETATLVTRFGARRVPEGVEVSWSIAGSGDLARIVLERSEVGEGSWSAVATERSFHGGGVVDLDRGVPDDRAQAYRLVEILERERVVLAAPVIVPARAELGFALALRSANPSTGPIHFELTLAHEAPVRLDIHDVQGRIVATPVGGVWPAGRHLVEWTGGDLAPGLYLVRYRFPSGRLDVRVVHTR